MSTMTFPLTTSIATQSNATPTNETARPGLWARVGRIIEKMIAHRQARVDAEIARRLAWRS